MTALDLTIVRKGRRQDRFAADGDPADPAGLQVILQGWLAGNRWDRALWGQFEMEARPAGGAKLLATVRGA